MPNTTQTPDEHEAMTEKAIHLQEKTRSFTPSVMILAAVTAFLLAWILATSAKKPVADDTSSLSGKQAELDIRLASTNRKRQELGYQPLQGFGSEDAEKVASRLTRDAVTLSTYADAFSAQLTEKNQLLDKRAEELIASEQTRNALTSQLAKLQNEIETTRQQSASADELRLRLEQSEARIVKLREELAQYSGRPTPEEFTSAKARILDLEAQLATIQLAPPPTPPQPSKLFAQSEADLLPHAQSLYRALSGLEDKADLEISAAYNHFATQLKASFLKEVRFDTGSSTLKPSDKIAITASLAELPKGAIILVVGYASTTGNADTNRVLSSNRATEVASTISIDKPEITSIQAVFLGQTKRFSSRFPERNQVCEVWALLP